MADQPSWLNDEVPAKSSSPAPSAPTGGGSSSSSSSGGGGGKTEWKMTAQIVLATISICLCVFMAAVGAFGIEQAAAVYKEEGEKDTADSKKLSVASSDIYVGVYMNLFALILFLYEVGYLTKLEFLNDFLKRNVGFLYGPIGNCCYTIFAAMIIFGLSAPRDLALGAGVSMAAWGPIKAVYYLRFPDHFDHIEKFNPKTDGVRM